MLQDHETNPNVIQIIETQINVSEPSRKSRFSEIFHFNRKQTFKKNIAGKFLEV